MFPTRLNLLSPNKRKYLRKMLYAQFVKASLESFVFVISLVSILFLGTEWVLQTNFNNLSTSLVTNNGQEAERNNKIKKINNVLEKMTELQKTHTLWTSIMEDFTRVIPKEITLTSLNINELSGNYQLSGTAPTRDDLLKLKASLESLEYIEPVEIPLSLLTQKEDISFSLTAKLKTP